MTGKICYHLDGSEAPGHSPCFANYSNAPGSCCILSTGADACLDSGLCYHEGLIFQGPCTDPTFQNCPHLCPDKTNPAFVGNAVTRFWNVFMCDVSHYYCRTEDDLQNYCNGSFVLTSGLPGMPMPTTQAAQGTFTVSTVTVTATSIAAIPSATCPSRDRLLITVAAGGGIPLGLMFLLALAGLIMALRSLIVTRRELRDLRGQPLKEALRHIVTPSFGWFS